MCYNQTGDISTLEGTPLKLVDKFTYLGSSVESTEKDIETRLTKAWTAINRLSTIWKSDLTDKMKRSFFQAAVTSILLYGCTTWTLTKRLEKKLDGNYTRMLRAILIKHNRHFLSTYFLLDPFVFPYYFYRIRGELIYVLSIVVCIPNTFYPTLGHHQGRILQKWCNFCFSILPLCKSVFTVFFLQSVICLFTRSRLYSKVLLYLWAAGSLNLKYVYFGSVSSLIQISLNIIDILCLHIFFWVRSNSRITFIVFGGNWFMHCP